MAAMVPASRLLIDRIVSQRHRTIVRHQRCVPIDIAVPSVTVLPDAKQHRSDQNGVRHWGLRHAFFLSSTLDRKVR